MLPRHPSSTRTDSIVPYTTLVRSVQRQRTVGGKRIGGGSGGGLVGHGGVLGVGWRSNGHGNGQRSGEGMLHRGNTSSNGTPKPTRPTIPPTHDQRNTHPPHTGDRKNVLWGKRVSVRVDVGG